jgi:hypothetical protein
MAQLRASLNLWANPEHGRIRAGQSQSEDLTKFLQARAYTFIFADSCCPAWGAVQPKQRRGTLYAPSDKPLRLTGWSDVEGATPQGVGKFAEGGRAEDQGGSMGVPAVADSDVAGQAGDFDAVAAAAG